MGQSLKSLLKDAKYRNYILAIFMVNMGWRAIITYMPSILIDFGGDGWHRGIAMAMCTVGITPHHVYLSQTAQEIWNSKNDSGGIPADGNPHFKHLPGTESVDDGLDSTI